MKSLRYLICFLASFIGIQPLVLAKTQAANLAYQTTYPHEELTIVGGGIVGLFETYYAYKDAQKRGKTVRVTILEKNISLSETTTSNIFPSLTPDEILSVVPRGTDLVKLLEIPFFQGKGIRVTDVPNINDSRAATNFVTAVLQYSKDEEAHNMRTKALLELGKKAMDEWQRFYDQADDELKQILLAANFNPAREPLNPNKKELHDGYRVDLIFNDLQAKDKAKGMAESYLGLGYAKTKLLSPMEVIEIDPYLEGFVKRNSESDRDGQLVWKSQAAAIWRPGGCIDTGVFLPKFISYLEKTMGTYTNDKHQVRNCFRIFYNAKVSGIIYANEKEDVIVGLKLDAPRHKEYLSHHRFEQSNYVFAPGEAVGTLAQLGFKEPAYSGFAGPSLRLDIVLPKEQLEKYKNLNHCMEVHQEGVVLAWQVRFVENKVRIGVAGTKAFYADKQPKVNEQFAKNRHLLQLNIINGVLPNLLSLALQKDTEGKKLTQLDLETLEEKGIAHRWVGTRAVAFDGFPTLGHLHTRKGIVNNARVTTHLGSGGASFSLKAVGVSRGAGKANTPAFEQSILNLASSAR